MRQANTASCQRTIPSNFKELLDQCENFYKENFERINNSKAQKRRHDLITFIEKFHRESKTLNAEIKDEVNKLRDKDCLVLMTAHQPNLLSYSGVLRKATLTFTLRKELEKRLDIPVVNFFGIADQDFASDRWVKSALLPAIDRREGLLTLNTKLPQEKILCNISKPSVKIIEKWKNEIEKWLRKANNSVRRFNGILKISNWDQKESALRKNFEGFWEIVEESHEQCTNYADFNAFFISKIINEEWEYNALFSRFSECQKIFGEEFKFLLSNFNRYSTALVEAIKLKFGNEGGGDGVSKEEPELVPFWYHCECGSKARLFLMNENDSLIGYGPCMGCGKEFKINLGIACEPDISAISDSISARAVPMTLIFFKGLGVSCYVGGIGSYKYLMEARHVAEKLKLPFPPVPFWRPHDRYIGVGQLGAILQFKRITGTLDVSKWNGEIRKLKGRINRVCEEINKLEIKKEKLIEKSKNKEADKKLKKKLKEISIAQTNIKKTYNYSFLVNDLRTMENVPITLNLIPSVIDYAINIGIRETSRQWIQFLTKDGNFSTDVNLNTVLGIGHSLNNNWSCLVNDPS